MLKKSDLKVIRGGALATAGPDEKFVDAYVTDTRLMGVLVIYIRWLLTGTRAVGRRHRDLHQFFYVETTEEGIESYQGLYGNDEDELNFIEQSMLGGLGAGRVPLSMNEAVFLVQKFAEKTREFGKLLPDEREDYEFILRREAVLTPEREKSLFQRICGKIVSENQLINSFLMRYFSRDFSASDMLTSENAKIEPDDKLKNVGIATLCRNEITQEEGSYICESVIEEDRGHRIVVSEIGVAREADSFAISSFEVLSTFAISPAEAAMKLSRPEFVTVYEIAGSVDRLLLELDGYYLSAMHKLTEGGKLYLVFTENNRFLEKNTYLLNDDVKEILFVTVEDQLVIGSYTLGGIKRLENRLLMSRLGGQLIEVAKYEFKEPILYDYTMSYGGDFVRYIEDIMGFEDDEE